MVRSSILRELILLSIPKNNVIFASDDIKIFSSGKDIMLETFSDNLAIDLLQDILSDHPEILVTNFIAVKNSFNSATTKPIKIGELKDRIVVQCMDNDMKAYITLNLPKNELKTIVRNQLLAEIGTTLNEAGITYGIKSDFLPDEIQSGQRILVAEGLPAINGTDAKIRLYQLNEPKPIISDNDKVQHYELKLINRVEMNDWLGEKIAPTPGSPGYTVKNKAIKPTPGKNINLQYDRNSVYEKQGEGITTLHASLPGAVRIIDGKVSVTSHLVIAKDVDSSTGSLEFDGSITIHGTIQESFYVKATGDIEVLGSLGISAAREIISSKGSVYIKGGISGRNRTVVSAAENVFTKFSDYATIECGGALHFGYYCMNSMVKATEIIMDSSKGQICGGNMLAKTRVICPTIGSPLETKTTIVVTGFERDVFLDELKKTEQLIANTKSLQKELTTKIKRIPKTEDKMVVINLAEKFRKTRLLLKELDVKRKNITNFLKAKGEGEITVSKVIYPNCSLEIKGIKFEIKEETIRTSFYVYDNELKTG